MTNGLDSGPGLAYWRGEARPPAACHGERAGRSVTRSARNVFRCCLPWRWPWRSWRRAPGPTTRSRTTSRSAPRRQRERRRVLRLRRQRRPRMFFETPSPLVAGDTTRPDDLYQAPGRHDDADLDRPDRRRRGARPVSADILQRRDDVFFETDEPLVAAEHDVFFDVYGRVGFHDELVSTGPPAATAAWTRSPRHLPTAPAPSSRRRSSWSPPTPTSETDVYERSEGATTLVSAPGTTRSGTVRRHLRGRHQKVFFETEEQLTAGDTRVCVPPDRS